MCKTDLEWSLTYVGSPDSTQHDQLLDSVLIGPVAVGVNKFTFEAAAPDITKLPKQEWIGTTVVLLQCAYHEHVFFRVGYFVMNEYVGGELIEAPESIAARLERHKKWEAEKKEQEEKGEPEDDEEDEETDEEAVAEEQQDFIAEDDDLDDLTPSEGEEDDEEDEEDEEDGEDDGTGGKRPPAGKGPPQSAAGKHPSGESRPTTGGKVPPGGNTAAAKETEAMEVDASEAPKPAGEPTTNTTSNEKKRLRDHAKADGTANGHHKSENGNSANGKEGADSTAQEPAAKKKKTKEEEEEEEEDDLQIGNDDEAEDIGPRWYLNVDPNYIQRNVLMNEPRVTLFTIQWQD